MGTITMENSRLTSYLVQQKVIQNVVLQLMWNKNIEIPDSVTSIGSFAFDGCTSLSSIEIPDSVTSIEGSAFYGCSNITDVYYQGSEEDWAKITINSGNTNLTSATIHYNYTPESQS